MGLFSADIKTMNDLYVHQLQDIYYAEKQIIKSLPGMIKKVTDGDLKAGLQKHLQETETQVTRLEQVFKLLGLKAKAVDCPAIDGIHQGSRRGRRRSRRQGSARCGHHRRRAGRRALRDRTLRHVDRLVAPTRPRRCRRDSAEDARRGKGSGQEADDGRRKQGEPESRELTRALLICAKRKRRSSRDDRRFFSASFQQPARPPAEPEPQPVVFGRVTTGAPPILGTCGRDAAFGLDGLTAPGMPRLFAAGLPVVPGGLEGAGARPGGLLCAAALETTTRPRTVETSGEACCFPHAGALQWGNTGTSTLRRAGRSAVRLRAPC